MSASTLIVENGAEASSDHDPATTEVSSPSPHRIPVQIPSNIIHSTEIVHSLFGRAVGSCWGDFSCHYHHLHGRLYAASNAVLFYSQLFGFERKMCFYFQDIVNLEAHRTTSIRITTLDDEQFVFKSFHDRSHVVELLVQLKTTGTAAGVVTTDIVNSSFTHDTSIIHSIAMNESRQELEQVNGTLPTVPPQTPERPSTPVSYAIRNNSVSSFHDSGKTMAPRSKSLSALDHERMLADTSFQPQTESESSSLGNAEETNQEAAWEEIEKSSDDFKETALDQLSLSCTLKEFFDLFFADGAPFPMASYQQDVVGDSELETSPWEQDGDTLTRTISFRHPISGGKTFGFGPSSVRTTSRQRLRSFGPHGTCVETSSAIEGMPAADCFTVETQWLLKPQQDGVGVWLTVRYETRFSKRTMLKKMIQKSIRQETTKWYEGYADMLQNSLRSEGVRNKIHTTDVGDKARAVEKETPWMSNWQMKLLVVVCILMVVAFFAIVLVLLFHIIQLHDTLTSIQYELRQLRLDNSENSRRIAQVITASFKQQTKIE